MSEDKKAEAFHWADQIAERIIREKGDKEIYTCASGITPSGTVHIGNFREIITVDLVVRALKRRGKKVRFIYSWDDYDVFRKVPKNMPKQDELATYLRKPITMVPDTTGCAESYARANEIKVEESLPRVGIYPEYIYQASRYRSNVYKDGIRRALEMRSEIRDILNEYRTEPLDENWFPVSVFSSFTDRDNTEVLSWDGEWAITYRDKDLDKVETIDIRNTPNTKLPWRIDWPMRWAYEGVDFEPGGKDHLTEGGSYDTSKKIVKLFGGEPPVTLRYDFIKLKGMGGKMSSSSGEVASLTDVLEIYTPEIARYLFAGTRPGSEFAISFDLDVLKIYEDYDTTERIYYGLVDVKEQRREKEKRIYELSQVDEANIESDVSYQVPFRHLCNLLQVHSGDIDAVVASLPDLKKSQVTRLRKKLSCAWRWIENYAPEDFRFSLSDEKTCSEMSENELAAIRSLKNYVDEYLDVTDEKAFSEYIYKAAEENGLDNAAFFKVVYKVLINKERGPKLAQFMKIVGKERLLKIFSLY